MLANVMRLTGAQSLAATGHGHQLKVENGRRFLGDTATKEQYLSLLRGWRRGDKRKRKQLRLQGRVRIQGTNISLWHLYNSLRRHGIASEAAVRWLAGWLAGSLLT